MRRPLAFLVLFELMTFVRVGAGSTAAAFKVNGWVFNTATCSGMASLIVTFTPPKSSGNPVVDTATASDGTFQINLVALGEYYVTVFQGPQQLYGNIVTVSQNLPVQIGLRPTAQQGSVPARVMPSPAAGTPQIQDPFSGSWALDPANSKFLSGYASVSCETRTYARNGDNVEVRVDQTDSSGGKRTGTYTLRCDGHPFTVSYELRPVGAATTIERETITCRRSGPNVVEGKMAGPPRRFYRTEVNGDALTSSDFSDAGHRNPLSTEVFHRTSP